MKLITVTQGADPRCGLALNETIGIDLLAADPSLVGNWHLLFGDLDPVHRVHEKLGTNLVYVPRLRQLGKHGDEFVEFVTTLL